MARIASNAKYEQIKSRIKTSIIDGTYSVGDQIPSQNELMKHYSVSYSTIIRALQDLVQEGYLIRIHGKGTFVAERNSRARSGGTRLLGVSIPSVDPNLGIQASQTLSAMESTAREHGYRIIVTCSEGDPAIERKNLEDLYNYGVEGFMLWHIGGEANVDWLERFKREEVPFVLFDRHLLSYQSDYVVTDNRKGTLEAIQALIKLGHKRIACFSNNEIISSTNDRFMGYQQAVMEAGLEIDASLINIAEWGDFTNSSINLARRLLQREQGKIAIFTVNQMTMRVVWQVICELGRNHDSNIALCTFDTPSINVPDEIPYITVRQPLYEIGCRTVETLIKKINGDKSLFQVSVPPILVTRIDGKTTVDGKPVNDHELMSV